MKNKKLLFLIIVFILTLTACSAKSNAELLNEAIQNSSIGDSAIKYTSSQDLKWYDFNNQDSKIQEYYMSYIKEIGEFISSAKLEKVKEEDVDGLETMFLKLKYNNKDYLLTEKYIYPETSYLIISVDDKIEYYFLKPEISKQFFNIVQNSDNKPFNHISLIDYLANENK